MTSTTTCNFSNPWWWKVTGQTGQIEPANGNTPNNGNVIFGSSTCVTIQNDPATTTTAAIMNGYTYGEIVIALFLFVLLLMNFFGGIINHVAGVRLRDFRKHDD